MKTVLVVDEDEASAINLLLSEKMLAISDKLPELALHHRKAVSYIRCRLGLQWLGSQGCLRRESTVHLFRFLHSHGSTRSQLNRCGEFPSLPTTPLPLKPCLTYYSYPRQNPLDHLEVGASPYSTNGAQLVRGLPPLSIPCDSQADAARDGVMIQVAGLAKAVRDKGGHKRKH